MKISQWCFHKTHLSKKHKKSCNNIFKAAMVLSSAARTNTNFSWAKTSVDRVMPFLLALLALFRLLERGGGGGVCSIINLVSCMLVEPSVGHFSNVRPIFASFSWNIWVSAIAGTSFVNVTDPRLVGSGCWKAVPRQGIFSSQPTPRWQFKTESKLGLLHWLLFNIVRVHQTNVHKIFYWPWTSAPASLPTTSFSYLPATIEIAVSFY